MQELTEFNIERATAKILMLKEQTAQNIIEIGKTLLEVKNNLEYGQFGDWLKNRVDYTHQTANKFMKIATEFPDYAPVRNLGTRKLLALAGLEEEDRQEVMQENNIEEMTTRELEQAVKEKKEIKKQLESEQEYSEELQEEIRQKDKQINELQNKIDTIQIPEKEIVEKEVVKEVIPQEIIEEKKRLEAEKKRLEEEKEIMKKRAEKAEETLRKTKLETKIKEDNYYDTLKLDTIIVSAREFLDKNSRFTYLKEELQNIPSTKKKFVQQSVNSIKEWAILMEQALNNKKEVVGDIIYGEGEIINE